MEAKKNLEVRKAAATTVPAATALASLESLKETAQRLTYRRVHSEDDLQEIGMLRQKAFDARQVYLEKFGSAVIEPIDRESNTYLFGVYDGSNLVASVRLNRLEEGSRPTPVQDIFADYLAPLLSQGLSFIDPSRLVVDPDMTDSLPGLALLTLRLGPLATRCLDADYCLAAVKKEHTPFYRRVFQMTRMAGPIEPDHMRVQAYLLAVAQSTWPDLVRRYPAFHYSETEGRLLFQNASNGLPYLSVAPTIGLDAVASQ